MRVARVPVCQTCMGVCVCDRELWDEPRRRGDWRDNARMQDGTNGAKSKKRDKTNDRADLGKKSALAEVRRDLG